MEEIEIDVALQMVKTELLRANRKFPPFTSPHEGYAVILEELDEMWGDIKNNLTSHSVLESIQVAAMAVKYIVSMRN